jgi:thiamine-phosphate pyrophosphorylase
LIRVLITDGSGRIDASLGRADVDFIQVREPGLKPRELADAVRVLVRTGGPRILVNDRIDIAIACGAAGVHLRDGSVSATNIRGIMPTGFIVMASCHSANAVRSAEASNVDFAVLAPIFPPLSKPSDRPPLGLDQLRSITEQSKIPVIALGGITGENAPLCIQAGATGVAGITLFRRG